VEVHRDFTAVSQFIVWAHVGVLSQFIDHAAQDAVPATPKDDR